MDHYCAPGRHVWTSGLMYVHAEDVRDVAELRAAKGARPIECERCEKVYVPGDEFGEDPEL